MCFFSFFMAEADATSAEVAKTQIPQAESLRDVAGRFQRELWMAGKYWSRESGVLCHMLV